MLSTLAAATDSQERRMSRDNHVDSLLWSKSECYSGRNTETKVRKERKLGESIDAVNIKPREGNNDR
jgi:hypothetical protein